MADTKNVTCPHCWEKVTFNRDTNGLWIGTVAGGDLGYWLMSGLGIAGAILGFPGAIAAVLVGLAVGAKLGNEIGEKYMMQMLIALNAIKIWYFDSLNGHLILCFT